MVKTLKKTFTLLIVLALLVCTTGCLHIRIIDHNTDNVNPPTVPTVPHSTFTVDYPLTVNKDLVPEYIEYDTTGFYEKCENLKKLAAGKDFDAIKKAYDEIFDEVLKISDNSQAAYLNWCRDGANETLSDIYQKSDEQATDCFDAAYIAIRSICEGPCSSDFKKYVGDYAFEEYASYEDMTEEDKELSTRENKLVADYYAALERIEAQEIDQYEFNDIVGPIYLELVKIRTQQAKNAGYENFAEYADAEIYSRSYSTEEAEKLYAAAKEVSEKIYDLLYTSQVYYYPDLAPSFDESEMLSLLKEYAEIIDPGDLTNSVNYMIDNGLIDIAKDSKRQNVSFTMSFDRTKTPFIFINESDGENFSTVNHEFGHYTAAYLYPVENPLVQGSGDYDVLEIHSTGLEVLYSHYYNDIYGTEIAPYMEAYELINLLFCVIDGALQDEFQREVYTHPDMTLDEINQTYYRLCMEYGDPYADYFWWQQIPHNFESPMYYISYGASAMASLQIWALSKDDYNAAISAWKTLLKYNGVESSYIDALKDAGLADFNDTSAIVSALKKSTDFVEEYSYFSSGNYWD